MNPQKSGTNTAIAKLQFLRGRHYLKEDCFPPVNSIKSHTCSVAAVPGRGEDGSDSILPQ